MNFYGLYQAVRSRLHFSQVAAWWSRSNGAEPSYIATRVVPYNEENLRKFRETPVEHTFPLAGNGDGNSIKVGGELASTYRTLLFVVISTIVLPPGPLLSHPHLSRTLMHIIASGNEIETTRGLSPTNRYTVLLISLSTSTDSHS